MKNIIRITSILLIVFITISVCNSSNAEIILEYDDGISENDAYNSDYFYRNDNQVLWYADPDCMYISEEDDPVYGGYFYIYGTTRKGNNALLGLRTKDFASYENLGPVLICDEDDWPIGNLWAPEVIKNETPNCPENEKYLMYFSGNSLQQTESTEYDSFHLAVACSSSPYGPFVLYEKLHEGETNYYGEVYNSLEPAIAFEKHRDGSVAQNLVDVRPYEGADYYIDSRSSFWAVIDPTPFYDENGDLYLYFVGHADSYKSNGVIYGVKMIDIATPDYSTLRPIAVASKNTVSLTSEGYKATGDAQSSADSSVNEGPCMQYHWTTKPDGTRVKKYYLTFSNPGYGSHAYSVDTAVSDSPLGDFVKIADLNEDDMAARPMSGADNFWSHISGAGHHSIVEAGDEMFIVYHSHACRSTAMTNPRTVDADRLYWIYDETLGYDIYYANGPTWSLQPIPEVTSGLTNIASLAYVTATNAVNGSSATLLNDNVMAIHEYSERLEFRADGSTVITLTFLEPYEIESIFVYNSFSYEYGFDSLAKVTLSYNNKNYVANNVKFNSDYVDNDTKFLYPGSAAVMAFKPIKVTKITIEINSKLDSSTNTQIGIGDIYVYGKEAQ